MRYLYRTGQKGFTLVEALVAVAIIGVMSAFSYGTYEYLQKMQVKAEANALGDFLKYAYAEARRRGEVLLICPAEYNAAGDVTGCVSGMANGFYVSGSQVWSKGLVLYRPNAAATTKAGVYNYADTRKIADFPVSGQFEIAGGGADPGRSTLDTQTANRVLVYDAMGTVVSPLVYGEAQRRAYQNIGDAMTAFTFTVRKKGTALDTDSVTDNNIKNKMCYEVSQKTNGAVTSCYTYEQRGAIKRNTVACACASDGGTRTNGEITNDN